MEATKGLTEESLAQPYKQFAKQTDKVQQMAFPPAGNSTISSSAFGDSVGYQLDLHILKIADFNFSLRMKKSSTMIPTISPVRFTERRAWVLPPLSENVHGAKYGKPQCGDLVHRLSPCFFKNLFVLVVHFVDKDPLQGKGTLCNACGVKWSLSKHSRRLPTR